MPARRNLKGNLECYHERQMMKTRGFLESRRLVWASRSSYTVCLSLCLAEFGFGKALVLCSLIQFCQSTRALCSFNFSKALVLCVALILTKH